MKKPFYQIQNNEAYEKDYQTSVEQPESFWNKIAETFIWRKKWSKTLEWNFEKPQIEWFIDGELNITENCIDRHLAENADKTALIWEPNSIDEKAVKISFQQLYNEVNKFANVLKKNNIKKGDRVCIYMPMIPEATYAMLACARIGAVHSVVFAGFSAQALKDRIQDAGAKMVITSDGLNRGNKKLLLKNIVNEAIENCDSIEKILTIQYTKDKVDSHSKDIWYHEEVKNVSSECKAETMNSEDPLFILYTSGSTGSPKGVVHTCGGYMVYTDYTFRNVFQTDEDDIFWCTADLGWITGHTYLTYGPLLAGVTTLVFEGIPTYPDAGRFWEVIEKHQVNIFYTAPTAIRSLMTFGNSFPEKYTLKSLKLIGSVGEPINLEAWEWFKKYIGKNKCSIVDTWWQTETGGIMLSGLGNISEEKPTFAGKPLPGIQHVLLSPEGEIIDKNNEEGLLAIQFPWPSMIRTTWGNHQRCKETYFSAFKNYYFTGDGAKRDENGMYRIIGRVDDVLNISGHRLGTAEIENAINEHEFVVESAVVGYPHDIKGQGVYAFVIVHKNDDKNIVSEIEVMVSNMIGKIAKPDKIQIVKDLPKTRSGKIMRRILRKIAEGTHDSLGDTSTLLDPNVVDEIIKGKL